ncbi:MAG TPA: cell division protein ZapA [Gemmatimonadaceae bacterium]|nr:cell division protein ZapA [Gemmatimonadaceae bacterium]
MSRKNSVKVTIAGEEYTLRTDEPAEHTQAVAAHVDDVIRGIMQGGSLVESNRAAILAALQITDQLFRERASREETTERLTNLATEVRRWLPPARRHTDDVADR